MTRSNTNAFCADYSDIAGCLFAIQALKDSGGLDSDPEALRLIRELEADPLKKLYNRTLQVLALLAGAVNRPQDFWYLDFSKVSFNIGFNDDTLPEAVIDLGSFKLDFDYLDFSDEDFFTGYLDETNTGFSSRFQTILNVFVTFCARVAELSDSAKQSIATTLVPVLDQIRAIREELSQSGLNPCAAAPAGFQNGGGALVLQAAGSDGSSGVARGIHLRWMLGGDLGDKHLPQGTYRNPVHTEGIHVLEAPAGYNKPDDFVYVSRTPYVNPARLVLDLGSALPAVDYVQLKWTYVLSQFGATYLIRLFFNDRHLYNQAAVLHDPQSAAFDFLKAYRGVVTASIDDTGFFAAGYEIRLADGTVSATLKLQATGSQGGDEEIILRKTVTLSANQTGQVYADNMDGLSFLTSAGSFIQSLSFETYADFLKTRQSADWTAVGEGFALSLDDAVVADRLENSHYAVDDLWPQYRNGTKVRVANYLDKWRPSGPQPGQWPLATIVEQYLEKSGTDPKAVYSFGDDSGDPAIPAMDVSYLDLLNVSASDYHLARMLGLACIDTAVNDAGPLQYIYKAAYTNRATVNGALQLFEFMSLPTGLEDARLPETPSLQPLAYGIFLPDGSLLNVTDENGYALHSPVRIVDLQRAPYAYEQPAPAFFKGVPAQQDFNTSQNTSPVFYGVEYRAAGAGYQKPAITNSDEDKVYFAYDDDFPATGVAETQPVMDGDDGFLFMHYEKHTGVHLYAIYAVNIFSRASALSPELGTDDTEFPASNTLKPPTGIGVQYIQQEEPLLFTTGSEQGWLAGRDLNFPKQDTGFTRIVFNWLDITDISFIDDSQLADYDFRTLLKPKTVRTWFRTDPPLQVAGVLSAVAAVPGDDSLLVLQTGPYVSLSGPTVSPLIAPEDFGRFRGSLLATPDGQFAVVSVAAGTLFPKITVKKIVERVNSAEDTSDGPGVSVNYVQPAFNSRFTLTENLSVSANWSPVAAGISLVDLTDYAAPVIESSSDDAWNVSRSLIGGITGNAVVQQLLDVNDQSVMNGYYSVAIAGQSLAPHPQAGVPFDPAAPGNNAPGALHPPVLEWYNGQVRLPLADGSGDLKVVPVIRIVTTDPILLYVYDADYVDNPISLTPDRVNFHPGYKAYLFAEPDPDHLFNGSHILPLPGTNSRNTFIGLQTADDGPGGSGLASEVSTPAILLARKITAPVRLDAPITYGLKVRPDATTRAAFTFDVRVGPDDSGAASTPYGFLFYRMSEPDVLEALYRQETLTAILAALNDQLTEVHYSQRFLELINLDFDPAAPGQFRVYNGYGFPSPDHPNLQLSDGDTLAVKTQKYQSAIAAAALPLTSRTVAFSLVKTGKQTENVKPTVRDIDGNLIDPADASFDPYPMVRQYQTAEANTTYLRFTDYTLSGASRFMYFFSVAEVTEQLAIGPLSLFAGPVTVLHTLPAAAPVVHSFSLAPPVVNFYLTPFSPDDPITKVRIFRADSQDKALSLQTMDSYTDRDAVLVPGQGIVVADDFADLPAIPFGEVIYYRLAFIRLINNERDEDEEVLGLGSVIETVTLIDTVNPPAPEIQPLGTPVSQLTWQPTANKGSYYLYQQNSKGNWQILQKYEGAVAAMSYTIDPPLAATDADGNPLYHRFKVKAANSSGLFNLVDKELTV